MAFSRDESQTCLLYSICPWELHCHKPTSMQTLFHSHSKLGSLSSQDAGWSPSQHILMFLGVLLSVLPQPTAVCPHQSSNLSVVSHSPKVGISRGYLPVQVLASSPDLPFLLPWLRIQQTYRKLFPRTESHPLIIIPGVPWPLLLPRERQRPLKARDGETGWPEDSARLQAGLRGAPRQTHSTTQSVKAAWEVSVKGEKWLLRQHSCLLPSFQSSQLGFGVETSAQTHPSPRRGQWVKGRRSGVTQWLTPRKCTWPKGSTQVYGSPRLHRHSPAPTASRPPKLEAHTAKALTTSCQHHTAPSLLQVALPPQVPPAMVHGLPLPFCTSMHHPHTPLYMQRVETSPSGEEQ